MESTEMIKFLFKYFFFALSVASNKKLKTQYRKHQYFYSQKQNNKVYPEPPSACCHIQLLCSQR